MALQKKVVKCNRNMYAYARGGKESYRGVFLWLDNSDLSHQKIGGGGYRVFPNDGGQFQIWVSSERISV